MTTHTLAAPPQQPVTMPTDISDTIVDWLQITLYVVDALGVLAVIMLGALMVLDKERGEPVSATNPIIDALKIVIGVGLASGAGTLAMAFM